MHWQIDRRSFIAASAATAAQLVTAGQANAFNANSKLRVAAVGTGNKGKDDLLNVAASPRVEIAAICNVDQSLEHFGWAAEQFPKAAQFVDYRPLFDKPQSFDAVIVSTPDHMHAPISLAVMQLGKHVFCQKPLTHTLHEARQMSKLAARNRLVTQMGNQIQSHPAYRTAVKLLRDGVIGKVREVRAWQSGSMPWLLTDHQPSTADSVPANLNWDLWLGVAPKRSYKSELYHPINWRGWQDFGNGQLGDFGCHILDPVFMALDLKAPLSVEAEAPPTNKEVWTPKSKVSYRFPGTSHTSGEMLPITWYDGEGNKPPLEGLSLPQDYKLPHAGSVLVGDGGTMIVPHWSKPRLFPEEKFAGFEIEMLDEVNHYTTWAHGCLDNRRTTSDFAYAGPLTEAVLLGTIAIRFPGEQLQWNAESATIEHNADANALLTKEYRRGWELPA